MKELDIKKITSNPNNRFDAINCLVKTEQKLLEAIRIMQSALSMPEEIELHKKRMQEFVDRFSY